MTSAPSSSPTPGVSAAPAFLDDGVAVTSEAFYAVACDPTRPVVVEACAGAGKTWMLVSRILRALLEGAEPQDILAITFTRKAAAEMRTRLDEWVAEFAAESCSDEQRVAALSARGLDSESARELAPALAGLQERLLHSGRTVQVRTFHSWFTQLIQAAPLDLLAETGIGRNAQLVDDPEDHEPEVFRRFQAAVLANPGLCADYHAVVERRGRSAMQRWMRAAWSKRVEVELADAAGVLDRSVEEALQPWEGADAVAHPSEWVRSPRVVAALRCLTPAMQRGGARQRDVADGLARALDGADATERFAAAWSAMFTAKGERRAALGDGDEANDAVDLLIGIRQAVLQHEARSEHLRLVRLSRALFRELAAYKRSRGLIEMDDLEYAAMRLLGDADLSGWLQERLDMRIRHLLIDEFQDTSPLQWHALLSWLSGYAGAGGGASGQRPPSVFIVGDPKQSIYRFRRAEPRVFAAATDFVREGLGGSLLSCDHTRRNAPPVLAALNQVFSQATGAGEFHGFRAHTTAVAELNTAGVCCLPLVDREPRDNTATDAAPAGWRDSLTTPRREPEEVLQQIEADQVADAVVQCIADGVAAGQIRVLARKRVALGRVALALAERGVPSASVEELPLMDAPEVRDLVALLDALASPGHDLSLAQALKSPVFGCSDDDLVSIARLVEDSRKPEQAGQGERGAIDGDAPVQRPSHGGETLGWWDAVQALPTRSAALARAARLLSAWAEAARRLPPHDLLDRIVHEGDVIERTLAVVPPARRVAACAAIDALLAHSLTLDGARAATPYNFVRAIKRRRLRIASPPMADAVQLTTVHGAKGLESDVVFVVDAWSEPSKTETASLLMDWPVSHVHPTCCAFIYAESSCPPRLQPLLDREVAARSREELNGLYVAMTRARQRLVVSATEPYAGKGRAAASWWERIVGVASPWPDDLGATSAVDGSAALLSIETPHATVMCLPASPILAAASFDEAGAASVADGGNANADAGTEPSARLGSAVHRVLEWAARADRPSRPPLPALCKAAAREFAADVEAVHEVVDAILSSPHCQHFFSAERVLWAANEVPVVDNGESLRIDRLVHLAPGPGDPATGIWWVLDYKLSSAPQLVEANRLQLERYRRVVARLQPNDTVRAAFITGSGLVLNA